MAGLTIRKKLWKSGSSSVIVIPKVFLDSKGLSVGDLVDIEVSDDALRLIPVPKEVIRLG